MNDVVGSPPHHLFSHLTFFVRSARTASRFVGSSYLGLSIGESSAEGTPGRPECFPSVLISSVTGVLCHAYTYTENYTENDRSLSGQHLAVCVFFVRLLIISICQDNKSHILFSRCWDNSFVMSYAHCLSFIMFHNLPIIVPRRSRHCLPRTRSIRYPANNS